LPSTAELLLGRRLQAAKPTHALSVPAWSADLPVAGAEHSTAELLLGKRLQAAEPTHALPVAAQSAGLPGPVASGSPAVLHVADACRLQNQLMLYLFRPGRRG